MNKNTTILAVLAIAAGVSGSASAAIVMTDVTSNWANPVGGVSVELNINEGRFNNDPPTDAFNQVRWGLPAGGPATRGRSGLGFLGNDPINNIVLDSAFQIGTLKHYNWTIGRNQAVTDVDLSLGAALAVNGTPSPGSPYNFTTHLTINETPNAAPCEFPSTTPCADRITFEQIGASDVFTINGIEYTFRVLGFGQAPGSLQDSFISQEGGESTAPLWAIITAVNPNPNPEPAPLALMALGLGALGWIARRNRTR